MTKKEFQILVARLRVMAPPDALVKATHEESKRKDANKLTWLQLNVKIAAAVANDAKRAQQAMRRHGPPVFIRRSSVPALI